MLNRDCRGLLLATVIVMGMFVNKAVAENVAVDLELVLAVDISLSMDEDELKLQRDGYIAAFRNPEIIEAIKSGPTGRIAATYVEWAGQRFQRIIVPWTLIEMWTPPFHSPTSSQPHPLQRPTGRRSPGRSNMP
jgi:Protein of unknown function (DUF1194)